MDRAPPYDRASMLDRAARLTAQAGADPWAPRSIEVPEGAYVEAHPPGPFDPDARTYLVRTLHGPDVLIRASTRADAQAVASRLGLDGSDPAQVVGWHPDGSPALAQAPLAYVEGEPVPDPGLAREADGAVAFGRMGFAS